MVNIRDEMLRKIRIRKNVENNMLGNDNKHEFVILSDEKIELINDDIFEKLKIAKENYSADIETYIRKGVEIRKAEQIGSDDIAETFFFYPIKGALQTISQKIKDTL